MKTTTNRRDLVSLSRRQMLGLATLTGAGLAASSIGVPEARAIPKEGAEHEPLEDFKHDLEGSEGWVGPGGSAKESTVTQLPVRRSINCRKRRSVSRNGSHPLSPNLDNSLPIFALLAQ